MRRTRAGHYLAVGVACCSTWVACSSGGGGGTATADPAEALTKSLDFGGQATPTVGPLPGGSETGPKVTPLPGSTPMVLTPGLPATFAIPYQGGEIGGVNIGFGGSKYFAIPVPAAQGKTEGVVNVVAQVAPNVCSGLSDICHQITCYEQVVLPGGQVVSIASAMQIVLNCSGADCNGAPPTDAGADTSTDCGHKTCTQYCDCVSGNKAAFDACDQAALKCSDSCLSDPNYAQCTCQKCAPPMIACIEKFCPPISAECAPHFTGCQQP